MATVRERRGEFQVQIRLAGFTPESRTFPTKREAQKWAVGREKELRAGKGPEPRKAAVTPPAPSTEPIVSITLKEIIEKYREQVKGMKGYEDFFRTYLNLLSRHHIAKLPNTRLTLRHFLQYKKIRLRKVKGATVKGQFYIYRKMLRIARDEWGYQFPLLEIEKVFHRAKNTERVVRYEPLDIEAVLKDIWARPRLSDAGKQLYQDCFIFSLETGVRRSELLKIVCKRYSRVYSTVSLPDTKNGDDRLVGLSPVAIEILERRVTLAGGKPNSLCFPVHRDALKNFYRRLRERTGLEEKHWHDIRHEALSAYFEKGLALPEVQNQSGHRSIASLNRYVHAKVSNIVSKLNTSNCNPREGMVQPIPTLKEVA